MFGQCVVMGATLRGVEALPVRVEVVVSSGIPSFSIVGMPDAAIQEARERVRAALRASGFVMPNEKVVVNLAPGSLKKTGAGFDLPIAVGILVATAQIDVSLAHDRMYVGELSLEGRVRPVAGIFAYALCARDAGYNLISSGDSDFIDIEGVDQFTLRSLDALRIQGFEGAVVQHMSFCENMPDFSDISGHDIAKRALQIAAAGNHGILMMGPPGSGKTMLASRLASILPPLDTEEALDSALVHSVAGEDIGSILAGNRPFRAPHHSATLAGLVGGGNPLRPGEISLAHNGVLFLDELAEFRPMVLQGIRQPMETGQVSLTRADGNVSFPARFMLIAASNPCPCGYYGDKEHSCSCTLPQIKTYQSRIGGPLMDRIDLHLDIQRISARDVMESGGGTSSAALREGVIQAREFASWRKAKEEEEWRSAAPESTSSDGRHLSDLARHKNQLGTPSILVRSCRLNADDQDFLENIAGVNHMSGRSIIRTLAIARTIADTEESLSVLRTHLYEALGFRLKEGIGV